MKSNKELAVEIYCAYLVALAIKGGSAIPDPRDEATIIRQIESELSKELDN